MLNIFGHSKYIHRQDSDRKLTLSIPSIAFGKEGVPFFEIYADKPPSSPIHIAFECKSKEEVTLFHNAAIDLGATDNGKPGYRDYFPNYYACYVIDPDGHNLEALFWNKS